MEVKQLAPCPPAPLVSPVACLPMPAPPWHLPHLWCLQQWQLPGQAGAGANTCSMPLARAGPEPVRTRAMVSSGKRGTANKWKEGVAAGQARWEERDGSGCRGSKGTGAVGEGKGTEVAEEQQLVGDGQGGRGSGGAGSNCSSDRKPRSGLGLTPGPSQPPLPRSRFQDEGLPLPPPC